MDLYCPYPLAEKLPEGDLQLPGPEAAPTARTIFFDIPRVHLSGLISAKGAPCIFDEVTPLVTYRCCPVSRRTRVVIIRVIN